MDTFPLDLHDPVRRVILVGGGVAAVSLAIAFSRPRAPGRR